MKRIRRVIGLFIMIMLSGVVASVAIINTSDENEVDMVALNTVSKLAAENWDNIDVLRGEIDGEYIIFDRLGKCIACSNETQFETLESAIRNGQSPMNIIKDGQLLGVVIIPLISELLVLQVDKDEIKEKINSIYNKAEQINVLVTNMFQSTLEELGQFKIEVKDEYASRIGELFSEMDYEGKITQQKILECIICVDMIRMEQIINNIVSNS